MSLCSDYNEELYLALLEQDLVQAWLGILQKAVVK